MRFIVSFMNFDSGAIKQTIHRDFMSAHAAVESYCDEAEDMALIQMEKSWIANTRR